ncbi:ATP-binding protein [Dyella choica]|uniref:ATP-binding protein n=1 Tax=Dyella choica TaxID=1927959 RepID=UPI0013159766|nr:ATP-binding protein [Dyella choica]
MTLAFFLSDAASGWFDAGPVSIAVVVLAALLSLTALLALAVLRMLFLQRAKLAEAEHALQRQSTLMQAQLDAVPFPVLVKDVSGAYLALNSACERRLGIESAHLLGANSLELPEHRWLALPDGTSAAQRLHQLGADAVREHKVQRCELDYLSSDGRQRTGLFLEAPTQAPDGSVNGSIGMLLDITEYRQVERNARATEQSLHDITQRIPVVVFAVRRGNDRQQRLAFIAGNLQALFGLAPGDLLEKDDVLRDWPFHDRIHPEDAPAVRRLLQRATRHRGTVTLDFRAYGAEGLRWIHLVMGTRRLPDRQVEWIGYFIDTTSINAHNQTLLAARDAAERASKAKADFLATMSHEIRTPMNGVIGMLELLGRTPLDQEQRELVHAVEDSAGVLLQVLNDVLDFSKLEAGNVRLDDAPFDLRTLVDNVVGVMTGPAHNKGLLVDVGADATLAGKLLGDSVRIRQILMNLLNNAVKFTEHGSVAVSLRVVGDDGHAQRVRISVIDTGIGIAADKQANLFTPFSQAESWTTRRYGGTGLGLAICRHLVQLMGGSVDLSSRLGEGTKVTLELRLTVAQRKVEHSPELAGRHAIVRLASVGTANALAAHLGSLGLTVEQIPPAQPMRSGVAANLLFIDGNDQESAALIAARPILVDTRANGISGDRDERLWLNANPLKWQSVARVCAQALKPQAAAPRGAAAPPISAPAATKHRARRILVAEDHPISQSLIRRQLDLLGWHCDVVGDGRSALAALRQDHYAMLLTDCQMPLMNGYELAAAWRQHESATPQSTRLPILAMTANALDGEIERCHEAGMDDYLSKPVQLRQLEEKLLAWAPEAIDTPAPEVPLFEDIFAEPGMQDLRAEMVRAMLRSSGPDLQKLDLAIAQDDSAQAQLTLHRMLGALQLFTNGSLMTEGRELMAALGGADADQALRQLPAYLENLRGLLSGLARQTQLH